MIGSVVARLAARRSVRGGAAWGAVFALVVVSSATGFTSAYPDAAARHQLARTLGGNGGLEALFGVTHAIDTVKGFTAWRAGGVLSLIGGIWALLLATRQLRGEEESGRLELALAGPTTRAAAAVSAVAGLSLGLVVMFAVTAAGALAVMGVGHYGIGSALFFALALVSAPAVFLAVGALASQLARTRRQAATIAGAVFGVSYAIRLVADSGTSLRWVRWASPLGWVEALRPLTGSRPLALLPVAGATVALLVAALWLAARRDYGSGALRAADTAPARTGLLGGPWGLAVRLTRPRAAAWAAAVAAFAAVVGLVAKSVGEATAQSEAFAKIVERLGGARTGAVAYLGLSFSILAALVAFEAAGHVAATREEEADGYLDNLLVRPVARGPWLLGRVVAAALSLAVVALLAGLACWATAAAQGTGIGLGRMVLAGVNILSPALLVLGVGTLAHAVAPRRAVAISYAVVAWSFLVELVGSVVDASHWILDLSILHHLAPVPAVDPRWASIAAYDLLAAAAIATAVLVFARRDLVNA